MIRSMKTLFWLSVLIFSFSQTIAIAQMGINTYQDCLIYATRQGLAKSKSEARMIEKSCREKFALTAPPLQQLSKPLSKEELGKLDVWNKSTSEKKPGAVVYNGNSEVMITKLNVLVSPTSSKDPTENFFDSEEYELNIEVPSFKTYTIDLPPESELKGDLRWQILSGYGY